MGTKIKHDVRTCPELMTDSGWRVFCIAADGEKDHTYVLDALLYAAEMRTQRAKR